MIPVLILTHGNLASELLQAAQTIDPNLKGQAAAMSLPWDVDSDEASRSLKKQLRELDQGEGALVLTDMFGGTPSNISLSFHDEHRVEVVTGLNLPMLIKLATLGEEKSLEELATFIKDYGKRNISVASELLPDREGGS